MEKTMTLQERLDYYREELEQERISMGELIELQALGEAGVIPEHDVILREAAGLPEYPDYDQFTRVYNPGSRRMWNDRYVNVFIKARFDQLGHLSIVGVEGPRNDGNAAGGAGQIYMSYTREVLETEFKYHRGWDEDLLGELISVWDRWHLNHMRAGTPNQESYLREHRVKAEYPKSQYDQDLETLARAGLNPDPATGYVYGTQWLFEPVPNEVLDFLKALPEPKNNPAWV